MNTDYLSRRDFIKTAGAGSMAETLPREVIQVRRSIETASYAFSALVCAICSAVMTSGRPPVAPVCDVLAQAVAATMSARQRAEYRMIVTS